MTALIVILSVLLFILLLLMTVVKVRVISDGDIRVKVGAGPIMVGLFPKKKKKIKLRSFTQKKYLKLMHPEEAPPKKKKDRKSKKDIKDAHGATPKGSFSDTKDFILELLSRVGRYTNKLKSRIDCLSITVGGKDAAATAVAYGAVSQSVAYLVEILDCNTQLKLPNPENLSVICDFSAEKISFYADVTVGVRIFDALRCAVALLTVKLKHDAFLASKQNKTPSEIRKESDKNGREQAE